MKPLSILSKFKEKSEEVGMSENWGYMTLYCVLKTKNCYKSEESLGMNGSTLLLTVIRLRCAATSSPYSARLKAFYCTPDSSDFGLAKKSELMYDVNDSESSSSDTSSSSDIGDEEA